MLVALLIVGAVAVALLALLVACRRTVSRVEGERDEANRVLSETTADLSRSNQRLAAADTERTELEAKRADLSKKYDDVRSRLEETGETLRKRTDLADAQAMQIHELSAERDDLQQQLASAEERIVTLAARPGVVVGEVTADDANAEMLWELEVARSERAWRNSVAINPVADPSPFESAEDPVRKAVEIEAAALREDVGALITVDWQAPPIESAARRLLVVRVAQEMLASAARAPGAARLVVTQAAPATQEGGASGDGEHEGGAPGAGDGELKMEFEAADDAEVINLIPPQLSSDLIDVRSDAGLIVTVRAD